MTDVIARIKINGKHFEIMVDAEGAIKYKKTQQGNISNILSTDQVFKDTKKGEKPSEKDLQDAFGTLDINEITKHIITKGEIQIPAEIRAKQRGERFKQIVDFLVRNSKNAQTDHPFTPDRIERSLEEAGISINNKPIESQMKAIISKLSLVMPIKIETKRLKITIPSQYAGQAYGLVSNYKESEEWLSNGDLKVIVAIPLGYQMEFYDKLNGITHGSAVSEEMQEE